MTASSNSDSKNSELVVASGGEASSDFSNNEQGEQQNVVASAPTNNIRSRAKIDNAYEREPVPESAYKTWFDFIGLFASRHTAGTEFAIGPLFVARGATAIDVVLGLFIGNILATLSWRYICAPIAVRKRLTPNYVMERVVGTKVMYAYDIISGLSLSLLGGAMFTVSATAVGVFFDVQMPELNDWLPTSWAFVGVVILCGSVTTFVAVFGITLVTNFGKFATPILIAGITYMAVRSMQMLGLGEEGNLWYILSEKVYPGVVVDDNFSRFGFAHCLIFAWFCDLQLHIGQNDQAILRYARTEHMGWASAAGMFVGHYYAWIVAGCMYAVQLQEDPTNTSVAPGPIANLVGGVFGVIIIIIAGWSTANPIMFSAGYSLQHLFPKMKTSTCTFLIGSMATVAALFPGFTSRVLELLAFAGLAVCPLGVILFADFWIFPRLGIQSEMAADSPTDTTNWPAVYTWVIAIVVSIPIAMMTVLEVFFTPLITISLSLILYVGLSLWHNKRRSKKVHEVSTFLQEADSETDPKKGSAEVMQGMECEL